MKIKYIGSVNKVMLPGIPGTFTRGMVYEVSDNIGLQILENPHFICVPEKLPLTDEPWQLKVQEVETPIEETPQIEEEPVEETPEIEEPPKRTRRRRTPKEPLEETPEGALTEPPEEKEKEKEVNTNGS